MTNYSRPRAALAMAVAALFTLTACGQGSATAGDGTKGKAAGSAKEVTVRYTNFSANAGNEKNLKAMIDAFEVKNPGITIKAGILPYGDYFTNLQTNIAGQTAGAPSE